MEKNWFTITKINKHIYALAEFFHWEQVVSYLIVDKSKAFLIDTGMGYSSIKKEIEKICYLPISVLLTHSHWDHIGSINEFETIFIFNSTFEINNLKTGFSSQIISELNEIKLFCNGFKPKKFKVKGKKNFITLVDGQIIKSDTFTIQVIHTPGHTPGSACFSIPELNVLFTGDTLYPGPIYVDLPDSNILTFADSIHKLKNLVQHNVVILPGHNAITAKDELLDEAISCLSQQTRSKGKHLSILG